MKRVVPDRLGLGVTGTIQLEIGKQTPTFEVGHLLTILISLPLKGYGNSSPRLHFWQHLAFSFSVENTAKW